MTCGWAAPAAAGGELTEIRTNDLWFTVADARELMSGAGVQLTKLADQLSGDSGCARRLAALAGRGVSARGPRIAEPLSASELHALCYLPTHLSAPENYPFRRTLSRPTCATCTPSSVRIAAPRPSSMPARPACLRLPRNRADPGDEEFIRFVRWPLILTAPTLVVTARRSRRSLPMSPVIMGQPSPAGWSRD